MIWLWIGIVIIFYLIMMSTARYDNFKIVGIPIEPKMLQSNSVQAALNQYKIKVTLFSIIFITFSFLSRLDFLSNWQDTLLLLILIAMTLTHYIIFIQLQDNLNQIKLHHALHTNKSRTAARKRVDLTASSEKGKAAPHKVWAWVLWFGTLIPLLFDKSDPILGVMLWLLPLLFLLLPVVYSRSIAFKTQAVTKDSKINHAYQSRYEWIKGIGFLILEAATFLGYILITLPIILGWKTFWINLGIGVIFLSVLLVMAWNSWQINQLNEDFLGEAEWIINETEATYRWGFYHNPADSRIFVPKVSGLGTTVNAAHPIGRWIVIATIALLSILLIFTVIMTFSSYSVALGPEELQIDSILYKDSAIYEDIEKVRLSQEDLKSVRVNGYGGIKYSYGNFQVEDYGTVRLYINKNNPLYIVVEMKEGIQPEYIIFNEDTAEETEDTYQSLIEVLNE